jgi:hypothetical protein
MIAGSFAVTVLIWLLLVPWDLSEVNELGETIVGGGDQLAPRIGSVLVVVTAAIAALAILCPWLPTTTASIWASGAWILLFAWRAGSARASGANLWMVGLVLVVLPCAALAVLAVHVIGRSTKRRLTRHQAP